MAHPSVLEQVKLTGQVRLIGILLYGSGLRLQECPELRVEDLDFDLAPVTVPQGKGHKDRRTPLPMSVVEPLRVHLRSPHISAEIIELARETGHAVARNHQAAMSPQYVRIGGNRRPPEDGRHRNLASRAEEAPC